MELMEEQKSKKDASTSQRSRRFLLTRSKTTGNHCLKFTADAVSAIKSHRSKSRWKETNDTCSYFAFQIFNKCFSLAKYKLEPYCQEILEIVVPGYLGRADRKGGILRLSGSRN